MMRLKDFFEKDEMRRIGIEIDGTLNASENGKAARFCRRFIAGLVWLNLLGLVLATFPTFAEVRIPFLILSFFSGFVFGVEYLLRLWSARFDPAMRKFRYPVLRYMGSFFGIIDFISVLPFTLPYLFPHYSQMGEVIDFLRLFLIFKLMRGSGPFKLFADVFRSVRLELFLAISAALIIALFAGILMYYTEREAQPEAFSNIGQGFWWAVITFATVGYGDIYPVTSLGKVLASFIALIGIGMIALPTGIISSAFMNRFSQIKNRDAEKKRHQQEAHSIPEKEQEQSRCRDGRPRCPHCGGEL